MKKIFATSVLTCILFLGIAQNAFAQTPTEDLQNGIEEYNALQAYLDGFTTKTIDADKLAVLKSRINKALQLFNKVSANGTAEQVRAAAYFTANAKYQEGFALGMLGRNQEAYDVFIALENPLANYTSSDFPIRYQFFDKNFIVKWENFAATQAEYLTSIGEISYNLGKHANAAKFTKLAIDHSNTTPFLKYVAINKILDIKEKSPTSITDTEKIKYALDATKAYDLLDKENKQTVEDFNYQKVKRGVKILLDESKKPNSASTTLAYSIEALPIAAKYEPSSAQILELYEVSLKKGASSDLAFAKSAEAYARGMRSTESARSTVVGVAATDRIAKLSSTTDCNGLKSVAELYKYWQRSAQETQYLKMAETCNAEKLKAEKKAAKEAKRRNSSFNFYTGVYVLPLFNSNPKRDYGGVVNFAGRKSALELSFLKINQNKENIFDLWIKEVDEAKQDNISRWDGYYAHVQPKFFKGGTKGQYIGVLLGYADKNFDPIEVSVVNDQTSQPSQAIFDPAVKQYIGMLTVGNMILHKGWGADMYWSIGANYSQFDPGNELIDREIYTISNPLLESRKETYWGFIMRFGITMGLNFGSGND